MNRFRKSTILAMTIFAGGFLAGCGAGATNSAQAEGQSVADTDSDEMGMSPEEAAFVGACNEARGALYRLGQMTKGAEPIDESDLGHGAGFMRMLAENRKAPDDIFRRIDEWRAAVVARSKEITSLTPRIENGRFVEPDTTDMDRRMLERVKPQGIALAPWVREQCGDLEDPFA
jgi:hypothetical protein